MIFITNVCQSKCPDATSLNVGGRLTTAAHAEFWDETVLLVRSLILQWASAMVSRGHNVRVSQPAEVYLSSPAIAIKVIVMVIMQLLIFMKVRICPVLFQGPTDKLKITY